MQRVGAPPVASSDRGDGANAKCRASRRREGGDEATYEDGLGTRIQLSNSARETELELVDRAYAARRYVPLTSTGAASIEQRDCRCRYAGLSRFDWVGWVEPGWAGMATYTGCSGMAYASMPATEFKEPSPLVSDGLGS